MASIQADVTADPKHGCAAGWAKIENLSPDQRPNAEQDNRQRCADVQNVSRLGPQDFGARHQIFTRRGRLARQLMDKEQPGCSIH
ncbi:hypothetical protein [Mesorhizobium sp. M0435]|uniref:hypothetical protein n=1 Tax=Mesorhizobium sp. M0435 TaxID=2956944 RepID=UPI00333DF1C4